MWWSDGQNSNKGGWLVAVVVVLVEESLANMRSSHRAAMAMAGAVLRATGSKIKSP